MKKFLSMVLALIMTASLVTISAGAADFTDASSISYKEAVEVMTAVGVVEGYDTGAFGPTDLLTREQAAKIICNLILGPTTADALSADTAPFKDVAADRWSAGYIAYCQKEGIISGDGAGSFDPTGNLTGYAFMKMLLVALGYNAEQEGYVGANWSINVAKQAIALGLEDGLNDDFNGTKAVTREEALLFALNTMTATMVEYPNNSTIVVGDIKVSTASNASEVESTNKVDFDGSADGKQQFCEKYFSKLVCVEDQIDNFGRPAVTWFWKSAEIGTYAEKADKVYTIATKTYQIRKDLNVTTGAHDFVMIVNDETYYVANVTMPTATSTDGAYNYAWMKDAKGNKIPGRGITVEFYYDKEDESNNRIVVIGQQIGKITAVKSDDKGRYVTVDGYKFYTADFAKGDWVVYTVSHFGDEPQIETMTLSKTITGEVTWLTDSYDSVKGDGTGDGWNFYTCVGGEWKYNYGYDALNIEIGDEITAWLDATGTYIMQTKTVSAATALEKVVLLEKNSDTPNLAGYYQGSMIYGDGKTEITTLYAEYDAAVGKIYNYTTVSGKLKLVEPTDYHTVQVAGSKVGTNFAGFARGNTAIAGVKVNAATGFVYIAEDGTIKTYVGYKNAPSIKAYDAVAKTGASKITALVEDETNIAAVVYVWVNDGSTYNTTDELTWIVTDSNYSYNAPGVDGQKYSYYVIKDLEGNEYKASPAFYDAYPYANYYVGALPMTALSYDDNGCLISGTVEADYKSYFSGSSNPSGYYFEVKVEDGVLYIDDVMNYYALTYGSRYDADRNLSYTDDVVVTVVAYNGDTWYETDITSIDGRYTGISYVLNDVGEVKEIVLKDINPETDKQSTSKPVQTPAAEVVSGTVVNGTLYIDASLSGLAQTEAVIATLTAEGYTLVKDLTVGQTIGIEASKGGIKYTFNVETAAGVNTEAYSFAGSGTTVEVEVANAVEAGELEVVIKDASGKVLAETCNKKALGAGKHGCFFSVAARESSTWEVGCQDLGDDIVTKAATADVYVYGVFAGTYTVYAH